ncbi:MAG: GNAT family N-acetyltransferase [Patescibacteria group bacterium]|jgi:hypothetical protein
MITTLRESDAMHGVLVPPQMMKYWADIIDAPTYVVSDDHNQINFAIMEFSFGKFAVGMPYMGYGCMPDRYIPHLLDEMEDIARAEGCLAMSVGTHPLSVQPHHTYPGFYTQDNFCQISELDVHPVKKLSHHRRMAFQNEISKLPEEYFIDTSPSAAVFDQWLDVYKSRCADQGATPFPDWFFVNYYITSGFSDIEFWVVRSRDEVLGGAFIAIGEGIADYGTSAFTTASRKYNPTTHLLDALFTHLIGRGIKYFNWQSSKSRNDGTYLYKRRWGAEEYNHCYLSKPLVDIDEITSIPLETVKEEANGCYILPYGVWG